MLDKGQNEKVEMYSAFYDPFKVCDSGLKGMLRDKGVTDVFVVGLAGDYCVKATAESAVEEGYTTFIVDEGTRPVMPDKWDDCKREMEGRGIRFVSVDGHEVDKIKKLT